MAVSLWIEKMSKIDAEGIFWKKREIIVSKNLPYYHCTTEIIPCQVIKLIKIM